MKAFLFYILLVLFYIVYSLVKSVLIFFFMSLLTLNFFFNSLTRSKTTRKEYDKQHKNSTVHSGLSIFAPYRPFQKCRLSYSTKYILDRFQNSIDLLFISRDYISFEFNYQAISKCKRNDRNGPVTFLPCDLQLNGNLE